MDRPVAQVDDVQQVAMTAYYAIIVPHLEQLKLLRRQLKSDLLMYNIHGILSTLHSIRRAGFRLDRAYHRFDVQMHQQKILRSSCTPVYQLLYDFIFSFALLISEQTDTFFSTYELSDIFVAEQIDWAEPFFVLEMLLDEHERAEKPKVVEEEPCAGIDLIENFEHNEPVATHKCFCCFCLFKKTNLDNE
jgi:hypothetical protein